MKNTALVPVFLACLVSGAVFVSAGGLEPTEWRRVKPAAPAPPELDVVTEGVRATIQALLNQGVVVDTNRARRAAIQAVATTADPLAWLLSSEEAGALAEDDDEGRPSAGLKSIELIEKWPVEICYVKFHGLYRGTGPDTVEELRGATNNGSIGLIIDLRGADGKGLDCVESLAGLFVGDDREIFSVCGWNGTELERRKTGKGPHMGIPTILLVDGGTCSAAELFAAVVKGGFEVLLIGAATRGDPLLREKVPVQGGEILYTGTRRVQPIIGDKYGPHGIKPDIVIEATAPARSVPVTNAVPGLATNAASPAVQGAPADRESADRDALMKRTKGDPVLQRAADILMGLRTLDTRALKL